MAQQSGEKALKACLYAMGKRVVIGHSLFEFAQMLAEEDKEFLKIMNPAKRLDRYYIPTRYPNGLPGGMPFQVYTQEDLNQAFTDAKAVVERAREFLIKKGVLP